MALRKVRNNIDRLFDKNLTDLIRGIRNNKENEARYIAACIEEIKLELRQDSIFIKTNAIEKLAYLQMLGYDISWASFNIIEVMASTKYSEKRIGYLAATQAFNDETDVLMLATNLIRKDLQSSNMYDVGVALSGLACFATPDLARDLVNDVVNLLSSSRTYVRKKAVLLLYKIFLKYSESLRPTFPLLRKKLEDSDPGVQCAAVNVICELACKNPRNYLSLYEIFFKLMNSSSNNWMLIKIIKLFGSLVPLESKIGKKLLEPLTNLINSTSAMSLLYECINTLIALLISISAEGPGDYSASIQLCVQKLGVLIEDSDQNLKYLGLLAMGRILQTHPKAVQAHKEIVLRCLNDKDESIRLRALDLLYGMVSKRNIMEIVKKLMEHVDAAEGSFYRDELLSKIISICSHNSYQYITNFEWYISVLVELIKVEGSKHGILIAEQIQDVTVRVQSIRHFSVSQMALLVENAHLLLSGNSVQQNNICSILLAAAWICGEYAEHLSNASTVLESMLRTKISIPGELLSVYVQNIAKLYSLLINKYESDDDWDSIESLDNLMLSKLADFQYADHLEAQQRACNLIELINFAQKEHQQQSKIGQEIAKLFEGELNPVAIKAQRKVPVLQGLNLDEWIYKEESECEEEVSTDNEFISEALFPTVKATKKNPKLLEDGKDEETKNKHNQINKEKLEADIEENRRRRKFEQENNPYYVKASNTVSKKTQSMSTNNISGITLNNQINSTFPDNKSKSNENGLKQSLSTELQSPLEILDSIGLHCYLKQQESTMLWETAKNNEQIVNNSKKKKLKKTKKELKEKKKKNHNLLFVHSSSDEGNLHLNLGTVVHHVNRDNGEMPENALSSNDENQNQLMDEFCALDIDLDEPLAENEKLFVPKPYDYAQNFNLNLSGYQNQDEKSLKNGVEKKIMKKKRVKQKSNASKNEEVLLNNIDKKKTKKQQNSEKDEKTHKKKIKKRMEKYFNDSKSYTCIESTKEEPIDNSKNIISFIKQNDKDDACCSGNIIDVTNINTETKKIKRKENENSSNNLLFGNVNCQYKLLGENNFLKMEYIIKSIDYDLQKLSVEIIFNNKSKECLRNIRIFFLEHSTIQPDKSDIYQKIDSKSEIHFLFELQANACINNVLQFSFEPMDVSQRLRGTVTYFNEQNKEDVINFAMHLSLLNFIRFATIGSTSYDIILSSGELNGSAQQRCQSIKPLTFISDMICKFTNFSVVSITEKAVSLYAHDFEKEHICLLIKKPHSKQNKLDINLKNLGENESLEKLPVIVSVKCTKNNTLATTIASEICKKILQFEEDDILEKFSDL